MNIDPKRKRPISVRVQHHDDEGGIAVREARRRKLAACDAFFLIQVLYEKGADAEKAVLITSSLEGASGALMSVDALYEMWVSLTGYVSSQCDATDPAQLKKKRFLEAVLYQMGLNEQMKPLVELPKIGDVIAEGMAKPETPTT